MVHVFQGDVVVSGEILDSSGSSGGAGELLTSLGPGNGTDWTTPAGAAPAGFTEYTSAFNKAQNTVLQSGTGSFQNVDFHAVVASPSVDTSAGATAVWNPATKAYDLPSSGVIQRGYKVDATATFRCKAAGGTTRIVTLADAVGNVATRYMSVDFSGGQGSDETYSLNLAFFVPNGIGGRAISLAFNSGEHDLVGFGITILEWDTA